MSKAAERSRGAEIETLSSSEAVSKSLRTLKREVSSSVGRLMRVQTTAKTYDLTALWVD